MSHWAAVAAFAALIAAAGALAYLQFRHVLLAALAVAGPWLGGGAMTFISRLGGDLFGFGHLLRPLATVLLLLICERIVRAVSAGEPKGSAVLRAIGTTAVNASPFVAALLLALVPIAKPPDMPWIVAALALSALACGAVTFGTAWLASLFPYTENFLARANRARERRERAAARLTILVQTRWAFSIAGTAAVLATIAGFGAADAAVDLGGRLAWYYPLAALSVFAAATAITRDWRMGAAFTLTLALDAAWMLAYPRARLPDVMPLHYGIALAAVAAALSGVAADWSRLLRQGDELLAALAQALQREGPGAAFIAAFLAPEWAFGRQTSLDLSVVLAIFSGLAVFPALAVTIHALLPRYRSVDEVFGKR